MRGGHNQTHNTVERRRHLDSFYVGKIRRAIKANGMDCDTYEDKGNGVSIVLSLDSMTYDGIKVEFSFQHVGYGTHDRCFFLCPACGERFRYIYIIKHKGRRVSLSRNCAKLNYRSQQITHGTEECAYRMKRLLRDKFHVTEDLAPIDAQCYIPNRPRGMRKKTYIRLMEELERVQQEYYEAFIQGAARIIGLL